MPAAERAAFWTQVIRTDAALEPIRKSTKFLDLDAQLAPPIGRASPARSLITMTTLDRQAGGRRGRDGSSPQPETPAGRIAPAVAS